VWLSSEIYSLFWMMGLQTPSSSFCWCSNSSTSASWLASSQSITYTASKSRQVSNQAKPTQTGGTGLLMLALTCIGALHNLVKTDLWVQW